MKKRVVGVIVLVALGILIPLVLSHCMHGDSTDNDSTRVYEITPKGDARAAASDSDAQSRSHTRRKGRKSSGDGFTLDGATGVPDSSYDSTQHPEAVSPNNKPSAPPVVGNDNTGSSSGSESSPDSGSLERAEPASGWVVQVASFGDKDNAERLTRELKKNFDAFYRAGEVDGKTYYRVRIGPFDNEADARTAAARARQAGRSTLVKRAD